jgi:hypothetical protein
MRSTFGSRNEAGFGFGVEFDPDFSNVAGSPDQLSSVWNSIGEVVTASPRPGSLPGTVDIDVERYATDFDLGKAINAKRTRDLKLPPLSHLTNYLTAASDYSERTRILALDGERLSLPDEDLLEWLINAEREMLLGTDNHPVFETALEDTACSIRRLPNGYVAMTEVPRQHIQALGVKMRSLTGGMAGSGVRVTIETPLRAAARYFLAGTENGRTVLRPGKEAEVTAFLVLTSAGYSFGLWSPQTGLFSEYAFLAPAGIKQRAAGDRAVDAYVQQAFDQLSIQISQDKLEALQLSTYAQVVWAAERNLGPVAASVAEVFETRTGFELIDLGEPVDEAIAKGLLLGSYAFGETTVRGAEILPPINLAHDILVAANTGEIERHREEEARLQSRKNKAFVTVMAAPAIAAGVVLALVASLLASIIMVTWRDSSADAKTAQLKPALERRKSYEANLKWYQEFISEVSELRKQQPVGLGLLYQLDQNYPFAFDHDFLVSELKLAPTGEVQMKGFSRNKDAVASFLKSLEFAGGAESGSRLFSDLAYEVQEISGAPTAVQAKMPTIGTSTIVPLPGLAPGVVSWSIKGTYLPVAQFAPKPATTPQPGAPAPAQPGTTAPPSAAKPA